VNRRRFLTSAAALSLASCGGGGGGAAPEFIGGPAAPYRPGILYGYFGDDAQQAAEVAGHTNLYMSASWNDGGVPGAIANIDRARKAGVTELVVCPEAKRFVNGVPVWDNPDKTIDRINAYMAALQDAGSFVGMNLRGIYWCDEPNSLDEGFVRTVNVGLRAITRTPLWTIFSGDPKLPARPGLEAGPGAWDVVGVDNYDVGCGVLGALNVDLANRMPAGTRRILVPGAVGGHQAQTDPSCFENFAYAHPDVLAIVPFIWIDGWANNPANKGIRSLYRETYTALGKRVTGMA
jgi:hypothetical protein